MSISPFDSSHCHSKLTDHIQEQTTPIVDQQELEERRKERRREAEKKRRERKSEDSHCNLCVCVCEWV